MIIYRDNQNYKVICNFILSEKTNDKLRHFVNNVLPASSFPTSFPSQALGCLKLKGFSILKGYLNLGINLLPKGNGKREGSADQFQISPLHLAAMMDRDTGSTKYEAMEILLAAGFDPDASDYKGWTPAHHAAALGDRYALSILIQYGAFCTQRNSRYGTPQDLLEISSPLPHSNLAETYLQVWNPQARKTVLKSATEVFARTSVTHFSNRVHAPSWLLQQDWFVTIGYYSDNLDHLRPENKEVFRQRAYFFNDHLPKVAIDLQARDDLQQLLPQSAGKSIVASQMIQPGEIICRYGGDYCFWESAMEITNDMMEYTMTGTNALCTRSYGSLIQDGHPNAIAVSLDISGIFQHFFVALEPIQPGEGIVFNYFKHPIKGPYALHLESRPHAFHQFWTSAKMQNDLAKGIETIHFPITTWEEAGYVQKLNYAVTTLSAYSRIILSEYATHLQFISLLKHSQLAMPFLDNAYEVILYHEALLQVVETNPQYRKHNLQLILQELPKRKYNDFLAGMLVSQKKITELENKFKLKPGPLLFPKLEAMVKK